MTTLNLSGNRIGHQGAEQLAAAMEHNSTVTSMDLAHNRIGEQGVEAVVAALDRNRCGCLVLTVSRESQAPEKDVIICTDMSGSQVACLEMELRQTVAILRSTIAAQVEIRGHLCLVCRDGTLLNDADAPLENWLH
eukprot:gnl/TRDRNA2_/TRDRNA2_204313_c0_seq1.p1 gnl/TRDRNA2_/TRDRNA2_204313_c0~~gnl/TRDRNA2_/TRDRNA2_204313_c0_seq1.p1  ORF type:complete len:136 (+),score=11.56 gnl/TRDRNA2_/TRDRNA2_204313_c0_seq1:73-480(+)